MMCPFAVTKPSDELHRAIIAVESARYAIHLALQRRGGGVQLAAVVDQVIERRRAEVVTLLILIDMGIAVSERPTQGIEIERMPVEARLDDHDQRAYPRSRRTSATVPCATCVPLEGASSGHLGLPMIAGRRRSSPVGAQHYRVPTLHNAAAQRR